MALLNRRRRGSWLAFGVRALGVVGVGALLLGWLGASATPGFSLRTTFPQLQRFWPADGEGAVSTAEVFPQVLFESPDRTFRISIWLLVIGAAAAALSLLVVLLSGLTRLAGRRSAVGANGVLQVAFAAAILVGVNAFSFQHYQRYDLTGRQLSLAHGYPALERSVRFSPQFTLPEEIAAELRQLKEPTTVVVYQRHKTFGQLSDKPDAYDYAAERKVVEKVQDLVGLFREFGPQFRVVVLDVEDEGYQQKLQGLTAGNPELAKALDATPENSILFHARRGGREAVQRLAFNNFFQLDKGKSKQADEGRGNLVLLPQGVGGFARRVLAIDEKKPRIALATVHEAFSTEGNEFLAMAGFKKSLELHGFEVVDVILKKWNRRGPPVPTGYTLGESQLERLEAELPQYDAAITRNRRLLKERDEVLELLRSPMKIDELNRKLSAKLGGLLSEVTRGQLAEQLEIIQAIARQRVAGQEQERNEVVAQLETLRGEEGVAELRRVNDERAKLSRLLAGCDLIVAPRMTLFNAVAGDAFEPQLHWLERMQADAVRDAMKRGKPLLALFGPNNQPAEESPIPREREPVEALLAQLGIFFGDQTILFEDEMKAIAQQQVSPFVRAGKEPPPLLFQPKSNEIEKGVSLGERGAVARTDHLIAAAMKVVAGAAGSTDKLDKLRLRNPRPVYYVPFRTATSTSAEFIYSDPASWNESQPFPTERGAPQFDPTPPTDPRFNTRDEERRGPFPVGVAVETTIPATWYTESRPALATAMLSGLGAAGNSPWPVSIAAAALLPEDRYAANESWMVKFAATIAGVSAAGVWDVPLALATISAERFTPNDYRPTRVHVAAIGHGGLFMGQELSPATEQLLLNTCNWLLSRDDRLPQTGQAAWSYPRVSLSERRLALWRSGTLIAMPAAVACLGALVLLIRKYR